MEVVEALALVSGKVENELVSKPSIRVPPQSPKMNAYSERIQISKRRMFEEADLLRGTPLQKDGSYQ
jgi:hypothetical protein